MKYIKNHLMFILPLMGMLLSLEFYFAFDRTTKDYENTLKEGYAMLVVSQTSLTLKEVQQFSDYITTLQKIESKNILKKMLENKEDSKEVEALLPHFYSVKLNSFVDTPTLTKVKNSLLKSSKISRVESFVDTHTSKYKLFSFIKLILKLFIATLAILSLFLIMKQVEVWKYAHQERMEVMETFGASLLLRSGVLFKVAIIDTIVATLLTALIFLYIKYIWASSSGIEMVMQHANLLFEFSDILWLFAFAFPGVMLAVYYVVSTTKKVH